MQIWVDRCSGEVRNARQAASILQDWRTEELNCLLCTGNRKSGGLWAGAGVMFITISLGTRSIWKQLSTFLLRLSNPLLKQEAQICSREREGKK